MRDQNFAFSIVERALSYQDKLAFRTAGGVVSYRRFADLVVHFARRMQDFGVDHRSRLGLALDRPVITCVAVVAASLLGAQWRRADLSGPLTATHSFAEQDTGLGAYEFTQAWFDAPSASMADLADFPGHDNADDTWLVGTSSGTTGNQKYIPLTYHAAWARIVDGADIWVDAPPVTYCHFDACGIVGIRPRLTTLLVGGTNVSGIPALQLAEKSVTLVFGSPMQVTKQLESLPPPTARLRTCRITGSRVTQRLAEMVLEHFDELEVLYGAAETGVTTLARFNRDSHFESNVGRPADGASIEIVDTDGQPVPQGEEGAIRIRTGGMAKEYLGAPELTQRFFSDGWFQPGDLGHFDSAGVLHLTGRATDVINMGGVKFNAAELDELIQLHPAVADGFCFIDRTEHGLDRLAAVVAVRAGTPITEMHDLREFVTSRLRKARILRRLYVADTVPRNDNGKPRRRDAPDLARDLAWVDLR